MTPEQLVKNFARCKGWQERYMYLIELGRKLPDYPEALQDEAHLVSGCQSRVWLALGYEADSGLIRFQACSDTVIVQGLLSLLWVLCDQQRPDTILTRDISAFFDDLQLKNHLTPGRAQGLDAIIRQIYQQATALIAVPKSA